MLLTHTNSTAPLGPYIKVNCFNQAKEECLTSSLLLRGFIGELTTIAPISCELGFDSTEL